MPDSVKKEHDIRAKDDGEFWSVSCASFVVVFTVFCQRRYAIMSDCGPVCPFVCKRGK